MDDPCRTVDGDRHQLEQRSVWGCTEHQETVLALIVELDQPDRVLVRVKDVGVENPCLRGDSTTSTPSRKP